MALERLKGIGTLTESHIKSELHGNSTYQSLGSTEYYEIARTRKELAAAGLLQPPISEKDYQKMVDEARAQMFGTQEIKTLDLVPKMPIAPLIPPSTPDVAA